MNGARAVATTSKAHFADYHLEPGATNGALQLGRGALGDGATVVDHHDTLSQLVRLIEVLGREQDRHPLRGEVSTISQTPARLVGSSPVVGSSRKRTGGAATKLVARSSRLRMPPE